MQTCFALAGKQVPLELGLAGYQLLVNPGMCWSLWPEVCIMGLDKCLVVNYWYCVPLPRLNSIVLRKAGQSFQSAAIRPHIEHWHLTAGWVLAFQILA